MLISRGLMGRAIVKRPIFSEKAQNKAALSIYTFEVAKDATKKEIRQALERQFQVDVRKVRTRIQKPKTKKAGKRRYDVQTRSFKIAEVILAKDQKIDLWEVPKEEGQSGKKEKKKKNKKEK